MNPIAMLIMIVPGCIALAVGMYLGFGYPFWSPLYMALVATYFVAASIATLDIRLTQARMTGQDFGTLPAWTAIFGWLQWALFCVLAVLNWRVAIVIFVVKFILKVLPVLETIGNILMAPFKPKGAMEL